MSRCHRNRDDFNPLVANIFVSPNRRRHHHRRRRRRDEVAGIFICREINDGRRRRFVCTELSGIEHDC